MINFDIPEMIFLNTAWMKHYRGITKDDRPMHGGEYIKDNVFGSEIFNFLPYNGDLYGYVQPPRGGNAHPRGVINIERLGAGWLDDWIGGILVVWVARSEALGSVIVGWYKDATVYREVQPAPVHSNRLYDGEELDYYIKTKEANGVLLPIKNRTFQIPRGRGGMGQANTWYADQENNEIFKSKVVEYIENYANTYSTHDTRHF